MRTCRRTSERSVTATDVAHTFNRVGQAVEAVDDAFAALLTEPSLPVPATTTLAQDAVVCASASSADDATAPAPATREPVHLSANLSAPSPAFVRASSFSSLPNLRPPKSPQPLPSPASSSPVSLRPTSCPGTATASPTRRSLCDAAAPEALPFTTRRGLFEELTAACTSSHPCASPSPDATWYAGSRAWGRSTSSGAIQLSSFVGTPAELQHLTVATSSRCLRRCISSPGAGC
ncbi:hypothetical protein HYH03_015784 [Edaphochlamys debaryana]|uniref:Uncharacterized protein n=1 Tax=Edaphochlamys debaryana TaxID=47281 RepID=A0A835XNP0_9CHLO|nr:hypothetical protein HYH03_015784 [Edaphochlamys debaryana]|eukprot:KAG2485511.1 hypothetical protein HYH03_015784 [Edaphochlamys debaryana]